MVKSTTGRTIADSIVIRSRISIAAKIELAELTHANKMFFVSFIVVFDLISRSLHFYFLLSLIFPNSI